MKNRLKTIYRVFLYVSILFFLYYLYKANFIQISNIQFNYVFLGLSILLLWAGFYFSTISWKNALSVHKSKISGTMAVYSHGISVFSKYIPGKIWVILGRASIVSDTGISFKLASFISLKEQLLYLLLGLILSFIPVLIYYPIGFFTLFLFITVVLLSIFLFSLKIHTLFLKIFTKILKKQLDIPMLKPRESAKMCLFILLYWIIWILAFYLFLRSIASDIYFIQSFAFPLSVCYGVIAIIFPGGIGVREGIMTGFLVLAGISVEQATTISVINRLWYITGEVFIFALAFVLKNRLKKNL